jgi:hypothetical protein
MQSNIFNAAQFATIARDARLFLACLLVHGQTGRQFRFSFDDVGKSVESCRCCLKQQLANPFSTYQGEPVGLSEQATQRTVTLRQRFFSLLYLDETARLVRSPKTFGNVLDARLNLRFVRGETSVVALKEILRAAPEGLRFFFFYKALRIQEYLDRAEVRLLIRH